MCKPKTKESKFVKTVTNLGLYILKRTQEWGVFGSYFILVI